MSHYHFLFLFPFINSAQSIRFEIGGPLCSYDTAEVCDGIDSNCDGLDYGVSLYQDRDQDSFGDWRYEAVFEVCDEDQANLFDLYLYFGWVENMDDPDDHNLNLGPWDQEVRFDDWIDFSEDPAEFEGGPIVYQDAYGVVIFF